MSYVYTAKQFIEKLLLANNKKSYYIKGCFGAPMTPANRARYSKYTVYNRNHASQINSLSSDTFGWDCVCLIKGILWGWDAKYGMEYGGAKYKSNDVPDFAENSIMNYCTSVSKDFSNIIPGEALWMSGHVGIYIGDGKVIESSPKWENGCQITYLANIGYKTGHCRTWTKHGKLIWIDYDEQVEALDKELEGQIYTVQKGDTLSKIGRVYGVDWKDIAKLNGITFPYIINVGQKIRIKGNGKIDLEVFHTVVKGDTLSSIGRKYGVSWKSIADLNGIKSPYIINIGQKLKIK